MRRFLALLLGLVLLAVVVVLTTRRSVEEAPPGPLDVAFPRPGVVQVRGLAGAEAVSVLNAGGHALARTRLFGKDHAELRFPWIPGTRYVVTPEGEAGLAVVAPDTTAELAVRLHAPLGQNVEELLLSRPFHSIPPTDLMVLTQPSETVDIMLEVEKLSDDVPVAFRLLSNAHQLEAQGVKVAPAPGGEEKRLEFEFDKEVWIGHLTLGEQLPEEPLRMVLAVGEARFELNLAFVSRELRESQLVVDQWQLPTDKNGQFESHRVADQLTIPNPVWSKLASWVNVRPPSINFFDPYAYQTLRIRNESAQPIGLFLTGEVVNPLTGEPVQYFTSPEIESTGGTGTIRGYARLGPGQSAPCTLPMFLGPQTPAGSYLRRVTITPMGSDRAIRTVEAPLDVSRSRPVFTAWVIGIFLLSSLWAVTAAVCYRRLVQSLGVRLMVLLSLLGSLQFCLHFVGGIVSNVLYAFLGPFNCLVGGLFTEVMTYLIITSTLFLVPRVGAMTLAGLVTYAMGGILFGSFGLTDILFVGSGIAFRELFLLLFGVTSFGPRGEKAPNVAVMMIALALADAAGTFTSLALHSVFYRLFFANWYIFLQVVVTGFAYTALGVYLGGPLGRSLRRVHL